MDIGKALTSGFNVLRKNPRIFVPALIIAIISTYIQTIPIPSITSDPILGVVDLVALMNWGIFFILVAIITGLVNLFLSGMIVRMTYDATRKKLDINKAANIVLKRYIPLLIASIVVGIIVTAGFIALIIPGIFLSIQLVFFSYAILIDNEDIAGSLKKSWRMVKGKWWNVFALMLIIGIVSLMVGLPVGILVLVSQPLYLIANFFMILFITPWTTATLTFAYLQMRKRR